MAVTPHGRFGEFGTWCGGTAAKGVLLARECYRVAGPRHTSASAIVAGVGALHAAGRWNAQGAMRLVYTSADPVTAMAEATEHFRYYGLPQSQAMPKVTVAIEVSVAKVLDLTDPAIAATLPVPLHQLMSEDWRAAVNRGEEATAQAFSRAAFDAGFGGLVVPSKPHAGGVNVLVFPGRLGPGDVLRVLQPDLLDKLGKGP